MDFDSPQSQIFSPRTPQVQGMEYERAVSSKGTTIAFGVVILGAVIAFGIYGVVRLEKK